jgi:uncharacterized membrane protein
MEADSLGQELTDQDRVLLVFGYLGPLALVSLIASRRELVKWHAKQGLLLFAAMLAVQLLFKPIHSLMRHFIVPMRDVFWAANGLILLGALLGALVCIVRGLEGERFKLPGLGYLADWL